MPGFAGLMTICTASNTVEKPQQTSDKLEKLKLDYMMLLDNKNKRAFYYDALNQMTNTPSECKSFVPTLLSDRIILSFRLASNSIKDYFATSQSVVRITITGSEGVERFLKA